jgi:serine/threonine protein kinase
MAPEQAGGRVRDISPAVDVYGLGAILYELLTGRPPFQGDTRNQTIEQVLCDEPVPPSRNGVDVPVDLETVCLKCLEKDPQRRYLSAAELADDLGRFLDGQSVLAVPLSVMERIGRLAARDGYQIIEPLGVGPQSTVYLALYGPLKHPVAVKVYERGVCTRAEWALRLKRGIGGSGTPESAGSLVTALVHPNIVPVQHAGWWDDAPFLSMEYAPLGSLAGRLGKQRFAIRESIELIVQLTETVAYLHRQGVVHANLKPSNVLFAVGGSPRLADFRSVASFLPVTVPHGDSAAAVTAAGMAYLAPELLSEPTAEVRPYTDIYGIGIILYELITGRTPFSSDRGSDAVQHVRMQKPVPPSQINGEVTPGLEACCMRCLEKNPWKRYRRAYDLASRLRYCQDHLKRPKQRDNEAGGPGHSGS